MDLNLRINHSIKYFASDVPTGGYLSNEEVTAVPNWSFLFHMYIFYILGQTLLGICRCYYPKPMPFFVLLAQLISSIMHHRPSEFSWQIRSIYVHGIPLTCSSVLMVFKHLS